MTSNVRHPRPVRDQRGRDSVDCRVAAAEIVRLVIQASRTAPRGTRPEWVMQLETDVQRADPARVTLDRLLALVIGAARAGANLRTLADTVLSVIRGTAASPAPGASSLKGALLDETTAESAVNPCEARVLAGTADTADEMAALSGLQHQEYATAAAMTALEVALYGPKHPAKRVAA